jgi:phospholipid/cholesterol/gamma-HCH transport system substrate-binding protein
MKTQNSESVRLGLFVLTGLALLILTLYFIGKNKGIFSDNFELKTRFKTVNGLVTGSNVRYAGIDVGAVKSVVFLNDTSIEITMNVDKKMLKIIRTNALTSLGTDGLIGNRVINIMSTKGRARLVMEGDYLRSKEDVNTDGMIRTLDQTNKNIAAIAEDLRVTVHHISTSAQLSELLDDPSLSMNLKASLLHLNETTQKTSQLMSDVGQTYHSIAMRKGTVVSVLADTTMAKQFNQVLSDMKKIEGSANLLTQKINQLADQVDNDYNQQQGMVNTLLKDTLSASRLRNTLDHVEKGTDAFQQNMEALKHNFLLRGYFKREEKKKAKIVEK